MDLLRNVRKHRPCKSPSLPPHALSISTTPRSTASKRLRMARVSPGLLVRVFTFMQASRLNVPLAILNIMENLTGVRSQPLHTIYFECSSNHRYAFLQIAYLLLLYACQSESAPLAGYTAATMTLAKTILYLMQEYFCGGCSVGHNALRTQLTHWIFPNM